MRNKMNFVSIFKRELVRVILSNLIRIARVRNTGESERKREREREKERLCDRMSAVDEIFHERCS